MKNWLITGANRGLGLEIARAALDAGDRVVATARNPDNIASDLAADSDRLITLPLDVTDQASIDSTVAQALDRLGRIDVLVNNAGYGQLGPFEMVSPKSIERQFATNLFGVFAVTRAILPAMRAQRSGYIVNMSSIAGIIGFDGSSLYCSTKHAMEGWSEALGLEVAPFGIRTTLIEPGRFRTDFLDRSSVAFGDLEIEDYAGFSAAHTAALDEGNHQQAGDPVKLGKAIVMFAGLETPPVRFAAGSEGYRTISARADTFRDQAEAWRDLSISCDIDA